MAGPQAPAQGGNAFTRHIGPLPMWGWLAIIVAAIAIWAYIERKKAGAATPTGTSATQPPEVIQTTPPEVNVDVTGPGPEQHHNRHRPRTMPQGVNPGGLNKPGPAPKPPAKKKKKRLPTVHKRPARHPGTNKNVPKKKKPVKITN